MKLFFRGFW